MGIHHLKADLPHFVKETATVEFHCHPKGRDLHDSEDQAFLQSNKIKERVILSNYVLLSF